MWNLGAVDIDVPVAGAKELEVKSPLMAVQGANVYRIPNYASDTVQLVAGNNGGSAICTGGRSGAGGVKKLGAGTQWLIGTNTYTGQTAVSNGELVVSTVFAGKGNFLTHSATLGVTNLSSASALVSNLVATAGMEFQNVSSTTTPLVLASNVTLGGTCAVKITGT